MQKILIGVISLLGAFLLILAFNHQFIESVLADSECSNNNHNKLQSITYYNIFSDLSRNFTGTVDKFRHDNDNNNPPQDSGNARR
jgi:hypothetical protein